MAENLKKLPNLLVVLSRGIHVFFSFGGCCRFEPSCSQYCSQAIKIHGWWIGSWLGLKRIFKCHPFGERGFDPVVERID